MTIFLTSPGLQLLARLTWQRAATMLVTDVAYNVIGTPLVTTVHSPTVTVPVHKVIAVRRFAYRPWSAKSADDYASAVSILQRDGRRCAYCGCGDATTVDHIVPRSRGGLTTFGNLVACCKRCNGFKADRTPEEAGMRLRYTPGVCDPWAADQQAIYTLFTQPSPA